QPIGGLGAGYQGDNITLTSSGDMLWPVWTDNSSGIYQIWTSPVPIPPGPNPVDEPGTLPAGYALEQNYPNPFNPSTVIRFTLPRAEDVKLSVQDLAGKTVATLVSGRLPAGEHAAVFTADGARVGSGIYICRLVTPAYRQIRKMIFIK
ncbi:MAG TPA: T9SS type A sorting domain-containing protein, partial [Bacteroidota bacterium]|nr:T9SS type A sorting domain-containing protein [Bacteroidota bacterium]